MGRFEEARSNLLLAGESVHALFRGDESEEALVGGMILAAGALVWIAPKR